MLSVLKKLFVVMTRIKKRWLNGVVILINSIVGLGHVASLRRSNPIGSIEYNKEQ